MRVNLCGSHPRSQVTLKIGSAQVAETLVANKVALSFDCYPFAKATSGGRKLDRLSS